MLCLLVWCKLRKRLSIKRCYHVLYLCILFYKREETGDNGAVYGILLVIADGVI